MNCKCCFGKYFCDKCNLFDDIDKDQYHCDKCGICRIGKHIYVHCDDCGICVNKNNAHKCFPIKETLCPICMMDLFSSTNSVIQMKCNHYIHRKCFDELLNVSYKCPICQVSIVDTSLLNEYIDNEINATLMPIEYDNLFFKILCNDCHADSDVKFHIVGLKCQNCGSYNTRKI